MELPKRKSIRLKDYDYSQTGAYFITICVKDRQELLGEIDVGAIINRPITQLSAYGKIVDTAINEIPKNYPDALVQKYVIMPNHLHMILVIQRQSEEHGRLIIAPTTLSVIIQQMKRQVSKQIGFSIWQKSFYDHIIRSEADYQEIWQYIDTNPLNWAEDCYHAV